MTPLSATDSTAAVVPPESRRLFHYTTADGLVGIVESRCLYATHSDFLNDSTECRSILDVLLPTLESELREITPKLIKEKFLDPAFLKDNADTIFRDEANNMLQAMVRSTNNVAPNFIASFCVHDRGSESYEHGLLSQWRGYGSGGFALEFDELELDELNKRENERFRYQGILTNAVAYRDHEQRLSEANFNGFAGALLKNLFPKVSDRAIEILGSKTIEHFARPFLSLAPFLKHPSFEEEREYRIVALCNRPSRADEGDTRKVKPIRFRTRLSGNLIPFIKLYDDLDAVLPIKAIIIGPHQAQEGQRMAVEIMLEKMGLEVPIRVSAIPFRD